MTRAAARAAAVAALVLVLVLAGCGAREEPAEPGAVPPAVSPDGPVSVPLEDTAGLGLDGEVTLASSGGMRTDVGVSVAGMDDVAYSASIRDGSCAEPGAVVHDLGVVEDGTGSFAAGISLDDLLSRQRAFVLSAAEDGVAACADLPGRAG